ncbi:MAG TPA: PAS domain S-box protein [Methanospirillum sp.]|uniref:PAS domain S-box protein n=1 Tax=Methanospirillum sp. TaxID=45200 RepID=UPI002C7AADAE|nr:PAS domain S-box protein [Methanospirillum sp.]HWQ63919.1 PAS domain S-box protein [Methanospirillum sp.]
MQRIAEELARVKELLRQQHQGMTITDIAEKLGKNKHSVGRYLDILHASGHVDLRTFGMAKVYTLSSRVPLSALLSYTTDLVMVVDKNLRVLQVNDPFLSLIGIDKDQVLFQEIRYIAAPNPAIHTLLNVMAEQIIIGIDLEEVALETDPKRYYHLKVVPTVFEDGIAGTTVILEDNTTERLAHDEIKRSREFFEEMIANMSDGLLVVEIRNGKKEILFVNKRFTEITGYSSEELATIEPPQFAGKEEKEKVRCKFKEMGENPASIQEFSFWSERRDGKSRYLNIRMSSNRYGDADRYYVLISDMTERRLQEEQQQLQWKIMRKVVDQFPHPISCYRQDERVFLVNKEFCKLFGCTHEEEATGKSLQELLPPDLYGAFISGDTELLKHGGHESGSIQIYSIDGSTRVVPVEKSVVSVGDSGDQYIFSIIISDFDDTAVNYKKSCFSLPQMH